MSRAVWHVLQYNPDDSEYVLVGAFRQFEDAARYRILLAYDEARHKTLGGFLANFWEEYENITIVNVPNSEGKECEEVPGDEEMQRILRAALRELDDEYIEYPTIQNFSALLDEIAKYYRVGREYLDEVLRKIAKVLKNHDDEIEEHVKDLLNVIARVDPSFRMDLNRMFLTALL